jgi:hypothetical protein
MPGVRPVRAVSSPVVGQTRSPDGHRPTAQPTGSEASLNRETAARTILEMAADTARLLPLDVDVSAVAIVVQTWPASMPGPVIEDPVGRVEEGEHGNPSRDTVRPNPRLTDTVADQSRPL